MRTAVCLLAWLCLCRLPVTQCSSCEDDHTLIEGPDDDESQSVCLFIEQINARCVANVSSEAQMQNGDKARKACKKELDRAEWLHFPESSACPADEGVMGKFWIHSAAKKYLVEDLEGWRRVLIESRFCCGWNPSLSPKLKNLKGVSENQNWVLCYYRAKKTALPGWAIALIVIGVLIFLSIIIIPIVISLSLCNCAEFFF